MSLESPPIREVRWSGDGFGLSVRSDYPLLAPAREPRSGEILELHRRATGDPATHDDLAVQIRSGDEQVLWSTRFPDGARVEVTEGAEGEHRIVYGQHAVFVLSPDRRHVDWAVSSGKEAPVQRFLLDTVLWWTALSRGFELLHASAVKLPDERLVAIVGPSGCGKTSLAIALMGHGAMLFADDVLALRREDTGVLAYPGPALMNVPDAYSELTGAWATPIAPFAGEHETWMAVDRAASEPASLSAVFALDRSPENALELRRLAPSPLTLMGYSWGVTNTGAGAQRGFETFADLAESVAAYHLSAQADASPEAIADLILETCA